MSKHLEVIGMESLVCANSETVEYLLTLNGYAIEGPVWSSRGPADALRTLLRRFLLDKCPSCAASQKTAPSEAVLDAR